MPEEYLVVELDHQPIELCKLLKIANLVSGGGEAKIVISEGYVLLNGEVEFQKRKKVYHEDVIEFNGDLVQVIIVDDIPENTVDNSVNSPVSNIDGSDAGQHILNKSYEGSDANHYLESKVDTQVAANNSKKKKKKKKNKAATEPNVPLPVAETAPSPRKRRPISF
jgi:ribosome-associated protein